MFRKQIVGIHGKKRAGKDTVAQMLRHHLRTRRPVKVVHYADVLKDVSSILFNLPRWSFEGDIKDMASPLGVTHRQLLIHVADGLRKYVGEDVFLHSIAREFDELKDGGLLIVADVRYSIEADQIRSLGGIIIHVKKASADVPVAHSSENGLEILPGDFVIENNLGLEDLALPMRKVFQWFISEIK